MEIHWLICILNKRDFVRSIFLLLLLLVAFDDSFAFLFPIEQRFTMKSYSNSIIDLFEEQFYKYQLWPLCAIRTNRADKTKQQQQQQHWKISVVNPVDFINSI